MIKTKATPTYARLVPEQRAAVDAVLKFLQDKSLSSKLFILSGSAGTGKTFCLKAVLEKVSDAYRFAFTAPTNKAAKVLRAVVGDAGTIYSLLGLRVEANGALKQVVAGRTPEILMSLDCIVVDEAGMVNTDLLTRLLEYSMRFNVKLLFLGDQAQLPPVGEAESPVWRLTAAAKADITTVRRFDGPILKLATEVRSQVWALSRNLHLASDNDGVTGVWKQTKDDFKKSVRTAALNGEFADGTTSKVIAWRNVTVNAYNQSIREALFGGHASSADWLEGERILAGSPCQQGEALLMMTEEEAVVEAVLQRPHPLESQYQAYELYAKTEIGESVKLLALHPVSVERFQRDSDDLARRASIDGRLWKRFWEHKGLFHDLRYGYAITAHRAQGSTYESVFVDYHDILLNRDTNVDMRCLYVACSRPQKRLFLG